MLEICNFIFCSRCFCFVLFGDSVGDVVVEKRGVIVGVMWVERFWLFSSVYLLNLRECGLC